MKKICFNTSLSKKRSEMGGRRKGFSLIELLTVIAIMSILLTMAVPAVSSLRESMQLSRAGQAVTDILALARQTALSRNRNIAVRFYQPATGGSFIALQPFLIKDDGTEEPAGRLYRLPESIVLPDNTNHFNLPKSGTNEYMLPGQEALKYRCAEFCFRRNGGTDLDPSQYWFLTVTSERERDVNTPANFVALLIEPDNGAVKISRP